MLLVGVMGSGRGSNLQSLIDAIEAGRLAARVVCVLSDVADAQILDRARRHGLAAEVVDCAPFKTKLDGAAEQRVIARLRHYGAEVVALAGFMRMVKGGLLRAFPNRVLNIHPSLLPAFPGLQAWRRALEAGKKVTGCTVHFVDDGMDTGPIITQRAVPILAEDTPESLLARIQEQERIVYPEVLQWLAEGRVRMEDRRVEISSR